MDHLSALVRRFLADEPFRRLSADELWARVRDDLDEAAVRVLLERVGGRVYAVCRAVAADPGLADEAFQETFCALVRHRARLPTYRAAVAWLYVTARSQARRVGRRQRRWLWRDRRKAADAPTVVAPEAGADAAAAERRTAVLAAVGGLPTAQRRAVELVYLEGMTHAEAADALGWSRGAVGKQVQRGLGRLRTTLAGRELVVAGGLAVAVPELSAEAAQRVAGGAVARAAAGGGLVGWKAVAAGLVACAAVGGGVAWHEWPRPAPVPAQPAPVAEVETLQAKNLRILHAEVLPKLKAIGEKLMPGNPLAVADARAYGSEVAIEFVAAKPLSGKREPFRLFLRYCMLRRQMTAWENSVGGPGGWRLIDPDRPLNVGIWNPFGKSYFIRLPLDAVQDVRRAFDALPPDPRAGAELAAHVFDPADARAEAVPALGAPASVAGTGGRHWMQTEHGHVYVRRAFDDGWRLWGHTTARCIAASDTHVYAARGSDIVAWPAAEPAAAAAHVATVPDGNVTRCMTVAGNRLVVRASGPGPKRILALDLADPTAGWRVLFASNLAWGLAGHGSRVFGLLGDRLVWFDPAAAEPTLADAGRGFSHPNGVGSLAVWGDRIVFHSEKGDLFARPLADPAAEWVGVDPHPPPAR